MNGLKQMPILSDCKKRTTLSTMSFQKCDSDANPEYLPDEEDLFQMESDAMEAIREIEDSQAVEQPTTSKSKRGPGRPPPTGNSQTSSQIENQTYDDGLVYTMDNEDGIVVSENGFLWGSECDPSAGKTPAKNVLHIRPGPSQTATDCTVGNLCLEELYALFGLIILAAALKDNH